MRTCLHLVIKVNLKKGLTPIFKHVLICRNPYIYTNVLNEVYIQDLSPEHDDVEVLAVAATKQLELLK